MVWYSTNSILRKLYNEGWPVCLNSVTTPLITSGLQSYKLVHLTIPVGRAHSLHLLMQKCDWSSQRHETNAQEYVIVLTLRVRSDPKETPCKIWFNARNDCSAQEIKNHFSQVFLSVGVSHPENQDWSWTLMFFMNLVCFLRLQQ